MTKVRRKSNKEIRKPKAEKPKSNASQPSQKLGAISTVQPNRDK